MFYGTPVRDRLLLVVQPAFEFVLQSACLVLNRNVSIPRRLIFDSRVYRGIPSFAAAPAVGCSLLYLLLKHVKSQSDIEDRERLRRAKDDHPSWAVASISNRIGTVGASARTKGQL
jgi:hypothetical protein